MEGSTTVEGSTTAVLADGDIVEIRALRSADFDQVRALHADLNAQDRYFRFLGPKSSILDKISAKLAREIDPTHAALGAFSSETLIGVAQYEVLTDPSKAEIALLVNERSRSVGVATLLLEHLVSIAREHGVRSWVALVLAENSAVLRVLENLGLPYRIVGGGPEQEIHLSLDATKNYFDALVHREAIAEIASLAHLFQPASTVVIGASRNRNSVGHAVLANLLASGYPGQVDAVNLYAREILGVPCVSSVRKLAHCPELAVICLPAEACVEAIEECGQFGVRAVVVISAGLTGTETGRKVLESVRKHGMRLVGPNCLGVVNTDPKNPLNVTFLDGPVPEGEVGVVTQSGGVGIALVESMAQLGLGVSTLVSTGDKYDISGNDLLLWWMRDARTRQVVLYLESFGNPRKFSRFARSLARGKPILAVRTGTGAIAQAAAASHTAAAATSSVTRDALYVQAGVIAVDTVTDLVDVLAAVSWQPLPEEKRVAVVSNAGGSGVLAADACEHYGLKVHSLSPDTEFKLRELLPAQASVRNPIDTTATVPTEVFAEALRMVLSDEQIDAVLAITVPTAVGDPGEAVQEVLGEARKPLLAVRPGQLTRVRAMSAASAKTASYDDPATAALVLGKMASYAEWLRDSVKELPSVSDSYQQSQVDTEALVKLIHDQLKSGVDWMSPVASAELLRLSGIPFVETHYVSDETEAVTAFEHCGGSVVIKADAKGLLHKSAGGGVALGVPDANAVKTALREMRARFGENLHGVVIQPMVEPGKELMIGLRSDKQFGPLVVFGLGGVDTDLIADRQARLAPLTSADATALLDELRSSEMLWSKEKSRNSVRDLLLKVSSLGEAVPEIAELDLNPVRLTAAGCLALDVRVRLERREPSDPFLRRLNGGC